MKNILILIGVLWCSIAEATVSLRVCAADSNVPIDSNAPILTGTRLTIYVDSNSAAESTWVGGIDFAKPVSDPDRGRLYGKGWDVNAVDYIGSHFPAAGNRANVIDWDDNVQQSFELKAGGSNMTAGTWFVLDYNSISAGNCTINLVEYQGSQIAVLNSYTIQQVANRDFNHDGIVDFFDYAKLALNWMRTDCNDCNHCEHTDLNSVPDGKIDLLDMMYFVEYWLYGQPRESMSGTYAASSTAASTLIESDASYGFSAMSSEEMMENTVSMPAIYLVCDTNNPDPNQEVTVYAYSEAPLFCMGLGMYITGDATITTAMHEADCNSYGWDNGWRSDPYIDPNGYVYIGSVRWGSDANGILGYAKFRYHSGKINVYIDTPNSSAFSWDGTSCYEVPFSTESLYIGRDPNEP